MNFFKKYTILIALCSLSKYVVSQEGTRTANENRSGKVMVIPFEPIMYMSEIDKKVNEQTKWTFDQIREKFRRELDIQLITKLKKNNTQAISFYMDSARMSKDLEYIYKSITLSYDLLEKSDDKKTASKNTKKINNGQLTVEVNDDKKFMNTKVTNPDLLGYLNKKYGSVYFIFINELDIKNDMTAYDIATDTYQREFIVHYTVMDKTKKVISSGTVISRLNSQENNPKKIVDQAFVPLVEQIANQYGTATKPKETSSTK